MSSGLVRNVLLVSLALALVAAFFGLGLNQYLTLAFLRNPGKPWPRPRRPRPGGLPPAISCSTSWLRP